MADGLPPPITSADEPAGPGKAPPPPLTAIRMKGPGAKGLNKPAILITVGGALAVILVLASSGLTSDPKKKPAETKPMMSDPARPEMAQSTVRNLPATYQQTALKPAAAQTPAPPLLGAPLPGDVAAFAPQTVQAREPLEPTQWSNPHEGPPAQPGTSGQTEAEQAERSGLFFSLREAPKAQSPGQPVQDPQHNPLTALTRAQNNQTAPPALNERVLFPGAVIPASLITEVNSEAPGPVIAQVTQTIYDSATGRIALIPQGARLMGDYKSSAKFGQSRIAIQWSRLVMPNGDELKLDEAAVDPSGAAGVGGKVDNHWGEVFGAAALGTLINVAVAATEDPQLSYGGIGVITRDPVDQAISEGVQRSASAVTNRVVDRSLSIPPTIRVEAGKRVSVIVTRRLGISNLVGQNTSPSGRESVTSFDR